MSVYKPTPGEIKKIVEEHGKWLLGKGGSRANLSGADLSGASLSGADLSGADLSLASLSGASLSGASLSGADLSRANLSGADLSGANLSGASLSGANLSGANLSGASLSRANLSGANLSGADLSWADLSGASLSRASLSRASLSRAKGYVPEYVCDLLMLHDCVGPLRAYKLVNERGEGHVNGGLKYVVGEQVEVADANTDPHELCAAGINVATLPWVLREYRDGYKVLLVEFWPQDIACIPYATDGKFRLHRCRVVGEKDVADIVRRMSGETTEVAR